MFIDDLPIEIEVVKVMLPEVTTILYERDTVYEQLACFNLRNNVSITNIEKRDKIHQTNQSYEVLKSQYENYRDYINALEIKMDIHEALPIEFSRISELIKRINKYKNGERYTVEDIKRIIDIDNVTLYSLPVSDRFSYLGIVSAFEVYGAALTLLVYLIVL